MGRWVTDDSPGFKVHGCYVIRDDQEVGTVFNAMWEEGDGVSWGEHYWKIHFDRLSDVGAGVGLTSRKYFKKGNACKTIKYLGDLSNGRKHLVKKFGPSPKDKDTIGILAVFEDDRLKMYVHLNRRRLGLAFDVPASTFKSIYPVVAFRGTGSATCDKMPIIPNIRVRDIVTFTGIEGDWKLINLQENGIDSEITFSPTSAISKSGTDEFSWYIEVTVNGIESTLSKKDDNWKTVTSRSSLLFGPAETTKIENAMGDLMQRVKVLELEANGNLSIKSAKVSTIWTRYDSSPGPFVGAPFP